MKTLKGGTLGGFIAGILLGLAVALAVAVYVTKVPVPLVDRGVQRSPDQDAIEVERNKDWNPNATIAPKANLPAPASAPAVEAPAPETAPAISKPSNTSADPLGQLIDSRSAGTDTPVADPFNYFIQTGAFRNPDEAESQRAQLAMLGFDAKVSEREQGAKPIYRVRLGPFNKKIDAEVMQERIKGQGIEANLVRVQR